MCVMYIIYKYLHAMRVHHFFSRLSTLGLGRSGVGGDAREETGNDNNNNIRFWYPVLLLLLCCCCC